MQFGISSVKTDTGIWYRRFDDLLEGHRIQGFRISLKDVQEDMNDWCSKALEEGSCQKRWDCWCPKTMWENTMARHAWPSYFPTSFLRDFGAKV